jgi:hypothetical protein
MEQFMFLGLIGDYGAGALGALRPARTWAFGAAQRERARSSAPRGDEPGDDPAR